MRPLYRSACVAAVLAASASAAPLDFLVDPEIAIHQKATSPNGQYSFWLTPSLTGYVVPVMSGPDGLVPFLLEYFGAYSSQGLVNNQGLAILLYDNMDPGMLAFEYSAGWHFPINIWEYLRPDGKTFFPYHESPPSIILGSLDGRKLTARVRAHGLSDHFGNFELFSVDLLAEWDFSQSSYVLPRIITAECRSERCDFEFPATAVPEPGILGLTLAGFLILLRKRTR